MGQDVCVLEEWQAQEVLQHLYNKCRSVRKLAELLGVSKSTFHRVIKGEQKPPAILRVKLCTMLPEEELLQILKGPQLLQQYGLIDENGRLNKPLAMALVDAPMQNEATREEILAYLLKYYKQQVIERLTETLPKITLK